MTKRLIHTLLISLTFLFLISIRASCLVIYYDAERTGEKSMVQGIVKALETIKFQDPIELFTVKKESELQDRLANGPRDTLLIFGHSGFDLFKKVKAQLSERNWRLALVSHQIFSDHKEVEPLVNIFFLPAHLQNTSIQKKVLPKTGKIVWTNGVPFDLSREQLQAAYQQHQEKFLKEKEYVVVILGGDAESVDGSILLYTINEASKLADYVSEQFPGKHIIVLNGPRTGKHDVKTLKVVKERHRGNSPLDPVTATFAKTLKSQPGFADSVTVYDFRFGEESMYRPVLGFITEGQGTILVPGESNSMIADIVALNLQDKALIYNHSAMNELHTANVVYSHQKQGMAYLDEVFQTHRPKGDPALQENANIQIAKALAQVH